MTGSKEGDATPRQQLTPSDTKLCNFIQSHQSTFFIGKEEKPIVVHAAAIAATSQQMDALINGGMEEFEKRCARIEDV
jgi:hypothetical protein